MAESIFLVFWGKGAPRVERQSLCARPYKARSAQGALQQCAALAKGLCRELQKTWGTPWDASRGTVTLSRPPGTAPTVAKVKRTSSEREVSAQGSPCRNWDSSSGLCSLYSVRSQIEVFTLAHLPPTDSKELVNHTLKRGRIFPRCHWNVFWN